MKAYLAVRANLGLVLTVLLGGNGPVDKEQVNVVGLELLERVLERPLHVLGTVQVVPDLGADKDVLALDGGVLLQEVLQSITDLVLVQVVPGAVQVSVAGLEGLGDSSVGLALGALAGEGTEADGGDGDAVAELEGFSVRHCDGYTCKNKAMRNWEERGERGEK